MNALELGNEFLARVCGNDCSTLPGEVGDCNFCNEIIPQLNSGAE
jgi:hypothetical protein